MERAALSIVTNLAEGSGRSHRNDRKRFFEFAMGSLRETQALLEVLSLKWSKNLEQEKDLADKLGAYLFNLIKNPIRA